MVNGDERELRDGATVSELVEVLGAPGGGRGMAVAIGGEVVPRGQWDGRALHGGERIEVVVAVQGG
jgi:sulfur carrier protein